MRLGVNLVVMLLTVIYVTGALEDWSRSSTSSASGVQDDKQELHIPFPEFVTPRAAHSENSHQFERTNIKVRSRGLLDEADNALNDANDVFENAGQALQSVHTYMRKAVGSRRRSEQDQKMMTLLLAYKMKFMALIPILIGKTILLTSTTALAGFFFALFAAVLGLRTK